MRKVYLLTTVLAFVFNGIFAQSIFTNPITGTNPNTANPYTFGQIVDPNLTASGIGRGSGLGTANANNRYNANNWNSASLDINDYFEFTLTPNANIGISFISFVYASQANDVSIANFAFRSSLDGFSANIGTPTSTGTTIDLTGGAYQNVSSPATFRFYAWGADQASRTFSINDFTFNAVINTLPITIEYFNGTKQSNNNVLNWKVSCNNSSKAVLEIERSNNGNNFSVIDAVIVDAIRCLQPFNYSDKNPLPGYNYYRLKMTDANNKVTYSSKIVLLNAAKGIDIIGLYPSTVTSNAILNITAAEKISMSIIVTDLLGRQVQKKIYSLIAGSNQLDVNFTNLSAGTYQITGYTDNDKTRTIRFVKQ